MSNQASSGEEIWDTHSEANEWVRHCERVQWGMVSLFITITILAIVSIYPGENNLINGSENLTFKVSIFFVVLWALVISAFYKMDTKALEIVKDLERDPLGVYPEDMEEIYESIFYRFRTPYGLIAISSALLFEVFFILEIVHIIW